MLAIWEREAPHVSYGWYSFKDLVFQFSGSVRASEGYE